MGMGWEARYGEARGVMRQEEEGRKETRTGSQTWGRKKNWGKETERGRGEGGDGKLDLEMETERGDEN